MTESPGLAFIPSTAALRPCPSASQCGDSRLSALRKAVVAVASAVDARDCPVPVLGRLVDVAGSA